jgi:hypothetical protein
MGEVRSFEIRVDGCRGADAPATYAQRGMWWATNWMGRDDPYFNLGWKFPLPAGADLDRLAVALRRMLERFDTFRTTFELRDGELRQVVATSGSLVVDMHEAASGSVEETATLVLGSLVGAGFRADAEWPIRLAVVTADGRPQLLVMAFNHLALDLHGWRVVELTLNQLLADPSTDLPDHTGWQPVDQAAYQSSAEGRAANRAALDRWVSILRSAPPTLFDFGTVPEQGDRYWSFRMDSRALSAALATVAERTRISDGAVLLAAVSTVLGIYSGHDDVVVQVNVANRIIEGSQDVAGYLCWDSLFHLHLAGLSFDAVTRRSFRAALETYQHGVYEPASARAIRAAAEYEFGAHIDLGCHLNDRRERTGLTAAMVRGTAPDFAALLDQTRVCFVETQPRVDTRFHLHAMDDEVGSVSLELMCDTRYVPVGDIDRVLRAIERLVVAAASRDLTPNEIQDSINLAATRRTGWIRHGRGWVDLPATRLAWRNLVGPAGAIFADPLLDGTSRLLGYAVGAEHQGVSSLHGAFVGGLGDRSDIRAPDFYVCCSEAPSDIHDELAWARSTVVEQGTGRPSVASAPPRDRDLRQ